MAPSDGVSPGHHQNNNSGTAAPVTFSHVQGNSNFRSSATNAVAVIPLLSSDKDGEIFTTNSAKSFRDLMGGLSRYSRANTNNGRGGGGGGTFDTALDDDLLLVVPNSSLTRPGDWRYDNTPLKHFHWGHGCQRLLIFDGRPQFSRMAHDRLINHALTRDWIDLCPSRRTAAVIGVLNMRDCSDLSTLHRAEEELQLWAERYSTPPYEVTAHGRGFERDTVVKRLFVFDSFDDTCQQVDLGKAKLGSSILAFPPANEEHTQMMDLHLNVVVNDLAVAIFQQLEKRIKESDIIGRDSSALSLKAPRGRQLVNRLMSSGDERDSDEPAGASSGLSANNINSVLNPGDPASGPGGSATASPATKIMSNLAETANKAMSSMKSANPKSYPQLLTPIDDVFDYSELSAKDADAMRKREAGRREKFAADLSLLGGSPMDAYERYLKAAEMSKSGTPDPLWYASAMEGCAAAHIAMSEAGGYNVDEYLENNFQFPDQIMALQIMRSAKSESSSRQTAANKQTLPHVIFTLGEEALNITGRHPQVAPFYADLLLKLATYCAEGEERDLMCRWGQGEGCYGGDPGDTRRWEKHSHTKQMFADLKGRDGEDLIAQITMQRCRRFSEMLHRAASTGALDPVTRVDVATRCISMCMKGLKPTIWKKPNNAIIPFPRKAAFFTAIAAEAASVIQGETTTRRVSDLWLLASQLYSRTGNSNDVASRSRYGWAALRAATLHAIALNSKTMLSSEAAEQLLALLSEIKPEGEENPTIMQGIDGSSRGGGRYNDQNEQIVDYSTRSTDPTLEEYSSRNDYDLETLSSLTSRGIARVKNAGIFSQMTASASLLTVQGKWADDDPIPPLQLPLVEASEICRHVVALSCVWSKVPVEKCSAVQRRVVAYLFALRKALPASSLKEISYFTRDSANESGGSSNGDADGSSGNGSNGNENSSPSSHSSSSSRAAPVYIASVTVAESEPSKILDRITIKAKASTDANDAMATFFNPYASSNKKKKGQNEVILIAEGEERFVSIQFGNRLSIPLEIHSCQIEFEVNSRWRILAPALSFTIPAKSTNFSIHFPFKPISKEGGSQEGTNPIIVEDAAVATTTETKKSVDIFEMKGLKITSLGKSFFIPIHEKVDGTSGGGPTSYSAAKLNLLPDASSEYPRAPSKKKKAAAENGDDSDAHRHKFEVVSSQPRLTLSMSGSVIEDDSSVSVYLADGEIYTTSPFILENHVGTSGCGILERLQIQAAGLPGSGNRDTMLFDSEKPDSISMTKPSTSISSKKEENDTVPIRVKVVCSGFNLDAVNKTGSSSSSSTMTATTTPTLQRKKDDYSSMVVPSNGVAFQIVAANEIGQNLNLSPGSDDTKIRIRFRYRGKSPVPSQEIWRKREVILRIVRVKGPRISSLTFRPDLSLGSAYSELGINLLRQNEKYNPGSSDGLALAAPKSGHRYNDDPSQILNRVGMDKGAHVCCNDVVVLLSVANETNTDIRLSNPEGMAVGGFQGKPLKTVRVSSGVSVRIPVVLERIPRVDNGGVPTDVVKQVVARTALQWEEVNGCVGDGDSNDDSDGDNNDDNKEEAKASINESSVDGVVTKKSTLRLRRGRLRIPPNCLKEIVARHPTFTSRICDPPCIVNITVGSPATVKLSSGTTNSSSTLTIKQGTPVDVFAEAIMADWLSSEVASHCRVTIEFCCARKEEVGTALSSNNGNSNKATTEPTSPASPTARSATPTNKTSSLEYVWCGQVRKCVRGNESNKKHQARVVILQPGHFLLSACAKIEHDFAFSGVEEIWWTPRAKDLIVEKATPAALPAQ